MHTGPGLERPKNASLPNLDFVGSREILSSGVAGAFERFIWPQGVNWFRGGDG